MGKSCLCAVSWELFFATLAPTDRLAANFRSRLDIGWGVCKEDRGWQTRRTCCYTTTTADQDSYARSFDWCKLDSFLITVCGKLVAVSGTLTAISLLLVLKVNYLHSHGLAHTELRLENVHISLVDRHVKVSNSVILLKMITVYYALYRC